MPPQQQATLGWKTLNKYEAPKPGKIAPMHISRRGRLTLRERRALVNMAYGVLDVHGTAKINRRKLDDIAEELGYLIRSCSKLDDRERERFVVCMSDEALRDTEAEEREALLDSVDIQSSSDDDDDKDDNNNSENDDDVNFIATEKEVQQELAEISREKQLQLTCLETDYEKKPKKRARLQKNNKDVNPLDNVD